VYCRQNPGECGLSKLLRRLLCRAGAGVSATCLTASLATPEDRSAALQTAQDYLKHIWTASAPKVRWGGSVAHDIGMSTLGEDSVVDTVTHT
jgi:hypothetical protein